MSGDPTEAAWLVNGDPGGGGMGHMGRDRKFLTSGSSLYGAQHQPDHGVSDQVQFWGITHRS